MANQNKTQASPDGVKAFMAAIPDAGRRADCETIAKMMEKATKAPAKMWGSSMVGFGSYDYKYASGREGTWMLTGFSPRKGDLTLYIMAGFEQYDALLAKLGKFKHGKSCLYIKSLDEVDTKVLQQLITASVKHMKASHPVA